MDDTGDTNDYEPVPGFDPDVFNLEEFVGTMTEEDRAEFNATFIELGNTGGIQDTDAAFVHQTPQTPDDSRAHDRSAGDLASINVVGEDQGTAENGDGEGEQSDLDDGEEELGWTIGGDVFEPIQEGIPQNISSGSQSPSNQIQQNPGQNSVSRVQQGSKRDSNHQVQKNGISNSIHQTQQAGGQSALLQAQAPAGQIPFPGNNSLTQGHSATAIVPQAPQTMAQSLLHQSQQGTGPNLIPQAQQTVAQAPMAQPQPAGWDNSVSNVTQARAWIAAHPREAVHANPPGDDVGTEYQRRLVHANNLFQALFQPASAAPVRFNPSQTAYFDNTYQANGQADVDQLLSTSDGRRRAQSYLLVAVEDALAMHTPNGLGVPKASNKEPADCSLIFSQRLAHMTICLGIRWIASDVIKGDLDTIAKWVQDPKKFKTNRVSYARNNSGKQLHTTVGKNVLGLKQNRKRNASSAQTISTPRSNFSTPINSQAPSGLSSVSTPSDFANDRNGVGSGQKRRRESDEDPTDDGTPSRAPKRNTGSVSRTPPIQPGFGHDSSSPFHSTHGSSSIANGLNDRQMQQPNAFPPSQQGQPGFDDVNSFAQPQDAHPNGSTIPQIPQPGTTFYGGGESYQAPAQHGSNGNPYIDGVLTSYGVPRSMLQTSPDPPGNLRGALARGTDYYTPTSQHVQHQGDAQSGDYNTAEEIRRAMRDSVPQSQRRRPQVDVDGDADAQGEDDDGTSYGVQGYDGGMGGYSRE